MLCSAPDVHTPLRRARSTTCSSAWPRSTTSPTTAWPCRCSSRSGCSRPLFLEGEAGVGKTSLASAVAAALDTDLIRLQCYEGLDVTHAVYEWDYARQLLELRILEAAGDARPRHRAAGAVQRRLPDQAAAAAGDRSGADAAGGAADRRDRSRRRGVRRLPARAAGGVPDHDPRARHGARRRAAARHPHLEPHARGARRAEAPLPLSVDRVPRRSTRNWRSSARACRTPRRGSPRR